MTGGATGMTWDETDGWIFTDYANIYGGWPGCPRMVCHAEMYHVEYDDHERKVTVEICTNLFSLRMNGSGGLDTYRYCPQKYEAAAERMDRESLNGDMLMLADYRNGFEQAFGRRKWCGPTTLTSNCTLPHVHR